LQFSKEIVRLVDIGVLEEDYSSEYSSIFPSFAIPKKNIKMEQEELSLISGNSTYC
jgi:hypothetical protein